MNASEWLKHTRNTLEHRKDVLEKAKISETYFYRFTGEKGISPSWRAAKRLEEASNGEMKAEELLKGWK